LSHGEAVAIGILVESFISVQLGSLNPNALERIKKIMIDYEVPLQLPNKFTPKDLMDAMTMDKKALDGRPRFVVIDAIGSALPFNSSYCTHIDQALLERALHWMNHDLHRN
nr:3-dehydroquinate synthase [Parachlamydiaceae bacterium]